jgi:hypothetical protein
VSAAGLHATTLLCRLLEQVKPDINGQALLGEEWAAAGRDLLRERVLTLTPALEWVNCASCLVELAPVLREVGGEQIVIDFQDARMGTPLYDLVSLLEDCYYQINEANKKELIEYYYNTYCFRVLKKQ